MHRTEENQILKENASVLFADRGEGGARLADRFEEYRGRGDVVVIALPRGGVVTGYQVAKRLGLHLDVTCPKKIGAPGNPEYAVGAITETGAQLLNKEVIEQLGISREYLDSATAEKQALAQKRLEVYRMGRPAIPLSGKIVLLIDDGLATGFTMKAAIQSVEKERPYKIVVGVPVSPRDTLEEIRSLVDEVVCLHAPSSFQAVGQFYRLFDQMQDEEVLQLLTQFYAPGQRD